MTRHQLGATHGFGDRAMRDRGQVVDQIKLRRAEVRQDRREPKGQKSDPEQGIGGDRVLKIDVPQVPDNRRQHRR